MAYVPVPKDLTKVKTKVALNLTKRQLIFFSLAAVVGIPFYAIEQCFTCLNKAKSPKWVLEGDIKGCFDNISHEWILNHIPMDRDSRYGRGTLLAPLF